jgi:hypothetical protein
LKRIALLAVIGAALLAPSSASAQSGAVNCPAGVEVSPSHVCVHVNGQGGEAVINPGGCSYINAWTTSQPTPGYGGICTQTQTTSPGCDGQDNDPNGANTGGCFWVKPAPDAVNQAINAAPTQVVTAMFICGNTSGEDPQNTPRRGCSIP